MVPVQAVLALKVCVLCVLQHRHLRAWRHACACIRRCTRVCLYTQMHTCVLVYVDACIEAALSLKVCLRATFQHLDACVFAYVCQFLDKNSSCRGYACSYCRGYACSYCRGYVCFYGANRPGFCTSSSQYTCKYAYMGLDIISFAYLVSRSLHMHGYVGFMYTQVCGLIYKLHVYIGMWAHVQTSRMHGYVGT